MTEIIDDWSQIPVPRDGTRNVSRWDPEHPLDFFRGRDADGNFALVLTALAETTPELPQISGIDIECKAAAENRSELVLTLVDGEQAALFRALCRDLLEATHQLPVEANTQGAIIVIGRIRRWQQLLGKRRNNLLSRQKIIGLVGELLFLENVMLAERPAEEAIRAWRGPYGDEQDFAVADRILETKSQLSSADQVIKVSSEAQLDTISGEIVVWHQTLASTSPNSSGARTLNEHVASIRGKIETKSPVALDIFEGGLLAAGYEDRPEYSQEAWAPVRTRVFEVEQTFPRLVPGNVPSGIRKIRYEIPVDVCMPFERSNQWLKGWLFDE
ncbi:PD-(D/E)XK motif protein [Hyphomonadaceae bacterium BL14]|nr:PD-(D/E)XK motif protein [Hyphomonadaceae bacterium BL14]